MDGVGAFQPMVGVVEWDPVSGQVRDCRFDVRVDSVRGTLWNSAVREIHKAKGGRGHIAVVEDAWGFCSDGKPIIVVPLEQRAGTFFSTNVPSGVAVIDSDGHITVDLEVTAGEYPGPVIGTDTAREMWQANRAFDGFGAWLRKTGTYTGTGDSGCFDDRAVQGGNSSEFLTRTSDGRLVYVTPLSVYGSSQSVTAVAITYTDEIPAPGTMPKTVIHRFDQALPSPADVDQVIRAKFGDLPGAAGLQVMEVAPTEVGQMVATLGQRTVATWTAEIVADPNGGDPGVCITSTERGTTRCSDDTDVSNPQSDPTTVSFGDLSELSTEELAQLLEKAAAELARRIDN